MQLLQEHIEARWATLIRGHSNELLIAKPLCPVGVQRSLYECCVLQDGTCPDGHGTWVDPVADPHPFEESTLPSFWTSGTLDELVRVKVDPSSDEFAELSKFLVVRAMEH